MTALPGPEAEANVAASEAPLIPAQSSDRARTRSVLANIDSPFGLGFRVSLGALAAVLLGLALFSLSTILIYIVLALFAALGLDPAVRALEQRNVRRPWAILTVFLAFALVIVGVLWLIIPTVIRQISQFVQGIPNLIESFTRTDFYGELESMFGDGLATLTDQLQAFLVDPGNIALIGGGALQAGIGIASGVSGLIIVLVLSLYFLASLDPMKQAFSRLAPARNRANLLRMTEEITSSVGGFLVGMVILGLCNGVVVFLLHLILGLPFPALMGVAAFFITLIPLVGSVLFWGVGTVLALFSSPQAALIFAVAYLLYMQVEAYVLTPRVMSRAIAVPGALVVIGALVGGTLLGLLGALVAIPVTASILLIIKQVVIPRQDAKI